jgi:hypothetical protein
VRAALAKAMGPARKPKKLEIEPGHCYRPEVLEQKRLWGFMVQLYGVRSERNWGIGDFTDLKKLAEIAAGLGAGVIGVNPLHATQGSPYSPSSRHALNVLYIDVEAVPGLRKVEKLRRRAAGAARGRAGGLRGRAAREARGARSAFSATPAEGGAHRIRAVRSAAREVRRRLDELAEGIPRSEFSSCKSSSRNQMQGG